MRSKFLACAAVAAVGLVGSMVPSARAADPKSKAAPKDAKKRPAEIGDAISKQMQWEDKVMGPDDKRAELDKIARAQALNKAAAEKAEREKAEHERQAAREAQTKPQPNKKAEIAVPSVEEAPRPEKKVEVVETPPPPPLTKPADDKFIDKILKEEGASHKRTASRSDDKELEQLLGSAKPAAKGKGKKGDMVDNLLESADKAPPMPVTRSKPVVPEWAKPEISSTPVPPPVVLIKAPPKKDDGVIHVVQGGTPTATATPARPAPVAARMTAPAPAPAPASRRQVAAARQSSSGWNDPFADSGSKKSAAAARDRYDRDPFADSAPAPAPRRSTAPPPRREPARAASPASSGTWNDPFADAPERKAPRRAPAPVSAPAPKTTTTKTSEPPRRAAGWKDPFTDASPAPASAPARAAVAMREPTRGEGAKWEVAARPSGGSAHAATPAAPHARWSVIKKRR